MKAPEAVLAVVPEDRIVEGFGRFDVLAAYPAEYLDRNRRAAERANLPWCAHCERGIRLGTAWIALMVRATSAHFLPLDLDPADLERLLPEPERPTTGFAAGRTIYGFPEYQWIDLGPECAKNLPDGYRIRSDEWRIRFGGTRAGDLGWEW